MREPVHVLVVSTSLNPGSRSFRLAEAAKAALDARGTAATLVDLREADLPDSGRDGAWEHPRAVALREAAARSTHLLVAAPIYNYQFASSAKNLVEVLGHEGLAGKTVGMLCSAGGHGSYMAPMSFATSLMLDFRCWIVPRFVYAVTDDFDADHAIVNPDVRRRIDVLVDEMFARG